MLGKILTISDELGIEYVDRAKEAWRKHGFEIDVMSITDAVSFREFDEYSLLAFTMSNKNMDMYMNGMQLIRGVTQVPIALFPYDVKDPDFE